MKRVKKVNRDPNPLFMQWLKEFRDEARQRENSGLVKVYNMCIENLSRFPLTLDTGTQCKVLTGFGKTICTRLDQKLAQHQAKADLRLVQHQAKATTTTTPPPPPSSTQPGLLFPVSPVLVPTDQLPQTPEMQKLQPRSHNCQHTQLSPEKPKPEPSIINSPCGSTSYSPPRSAIFDLSPEIDLRSQEEKDLELALALSQREVSGGGQEGLEDDVAHAHLSQLEQDHQFALKLQAELSGGSTRNDKSPPPFSFDIASDMDYELARRLSQGGGSDNEDDLPDISLSGGRTTPAQDSNTNQPLTDLANANTEYSVPVVKTAAHNISEVSSDDEEVVTTATSDPLDKLFANDPVFNLGKKTGKGKSKKKLDKSQPFDDTSHSTSKKTPTRKKTPVSTPKAYVPKARTGAYAVLLTLSHQSAEPGYPGYLSKAELCQAAQPLADQSFTLASVRAEHYNAWSGVGTLLKHGLVTKWSNPAKFNITDKGLELARRIVSIERGEEGVEEGERESVKRRLEPEGGGQKRKARNVSGQREGEKENTRNKRVKVKSSNDSHKIPSAVDEPSDAVDDDLMLAIELSKRNAAASASSQAMPAVGVEALNGLGVSAVNFSLGDSFSMEQTLNEEDFAVPGSSRSPPVAQPSTTNSSTLPLPLALAAMYRMQMAAAGPQADTHRPGFVLSGGDFDILLCVDNTETAGGGVGGRKTLKVETVRHLQQCGVMYDRRNLNIGDFLWIARERVGEVGGQFRQKQPRELVLPFIVERKRLDDLWMSVKDGRYEEQKFRMKGCGLPHLYYLIEDHPGQKQLWGRAGQGGALVTPEAIEQAVANTAVQEGFTVKKTADQKGTIEYLTLFTRLLRDKYKNLDLTSCTNSDLADGLVGRRDTTLLTFQEFNDSSKKNKQLTITEVFAKMLLRLKGLSVDMAQTIVRVYPTPRDLMEAYTRCGNGVERVKLIADRAYGLEGKRKVPKAVAEALMKFWTSASLV